MAEIEAQVLERYGYTLEKFLSSGKDQLTERIFEDLCAKIDSVSLSLQFIVAGFDGDGVGHLAYIDGDRAPSDHTSLGYCVIGSGSTSAYTTLTFHAGKGHIGEHASLHESIYCCCDAKFMAESASDVGRGKFLTVLEFGQKDQNILSPRIDLEIRREWELRGAPKVPQSALKLIPQMLFSTEDLGKDGVLRRAVGKFAKGNARSRREYKALQRAIQAHFDKVASAGGETNPKAQLDPQPPKV